MYQQTLGRFQSRDPLAENGMDVMTDTGFFGDRLAAMRANPWYYGGNGGNLYTYVDNNPVNFTEPSGLDSQGRPPTNPPQYDEINCSNIPNHYCKCPDLRFNKPGWTNCNRHAFAAKCTPLALDCKCICYYKCWTKPPRIYITSIGCLIIIGEDPDQKFVIEYFDASLENQECKSTIRVG